MYVGDIEKKTISYGNDWFVVYLSIYLHINKIDVGRYLHTTYVPS